MMDNFVVWMRSEMEARGITAAELARKTGIHPTQFSRWFNSKTGMQPSLRNINRIEAALKTYRRRRQASGS